MSNFAVGSLLDDNIWHDVSISRNFREIFFSVDRVSVRSSVKGEYSTLNLNNAVILIVLDVGIMNRYFNDLCDFCSWVSSFISEAFRINKKE